MQDMGLLAFWRRAVRDDVELPPEFDLTFDYATGHCVTVWREFNRIGLKYKSMH
jgi:hypothetical protein